jgi:hypothetical protein
LSIVSVPGRQLRFNPLAEAELFEAARWYDERSTGLGAAFVRARPRPRMHVGARGRTGL